MAINPLIASALSVTQILAPFSRGLSSASFAPPNDPTAQINAIDQTSGYPLQYPQDRPKYYMSFDIYDYSRQSLTTLGTLQSSNYRTIVLPLPSQLVDTHQVHWSDRVEVGTIAGAGITEAQSIINGTRTNKSTGDNAATAAAGATVAGLGSVGLGGVTSGVESLLGLSPNQFMTVLMLGPLYKRHSFTWSLSPHNKNESEILRNIVQTFNNAMSPNFTAGGGIWVFPKIFQIVLVPNNRFLYKFKPAVLENFTVNYTPGGRPSMYKDADTTGQNNAPEGLMINARFLELEFWTEGNYNDAVDTTGSPSTADTIVAPNNEGLNKFKNFIDKAQESITNFTTPPSDPTGGNQDPNSVNN